MERASERPKGFSTASRHSEELTKAFTARIPLGRMGEPDDIAKVVLFLSSSASDYMAGSLIYELILVCVKCNQLNGVLPSLAEKAGDADILFLQNNWSGTAEIEQYLTPPRFVLGFPSVGGGRDEHGIQCALGSGTMLGEKDGQITPRLKKIAGIIREAGFKPKLADLFQGPATTIVRLSFMCLMKILDSMPCGLAAENAFIGPHL